MVASTPQIADLPSLRPADLSFEFLESGVDEVARGGLFRDWRSLPCLLTVTVSGGQFQLRTRGETTRISGHDLLVLPAGTSHQIHCSAGLRITWAHFQFRLFGSVDLFSLFRPARFALAGVSAQDAAQALSRLVNEAGCSRSSLPTAARLNALGFRWLESVSGLLALDESAATRQGMARELLPAIRFLEENALRPPPIGEVAERVGLSISAFNRRFRQTTGLAPAQFTAERRFERAQRLLLATGRSVTEVARDVGYDNPFHFTRFFRKHAGVSPSVWRERASFQNPSSIPIANPARAKRGLP
jgi:AraC-like DNA-binding protein